MDFLRPCSASLFRLALFQNQNDKREHLHLHLHLHLYFQLASCRGVRRTVPDTRCSMLCSAKSLADAVSSRPSLTHPTGFFRSATSESPCQPPAPSGQPVGFSNSAIVRQAILPEVLRSSLPRHDSQIVTRASVYNGTDLRAGSLDHHRVPGSITATVQEQINRPYLLLQLAAEMPS